MGPEATTAMQQKYMLDFKGDIPYMYDDQVQVFFLFLQ